MKPQIENSYQKIVGFKRKADKHRGGSSCTASQKIANCRAYERLSYYLADAIAGLAKRLCTESVHQDSLQEFTACRLIPLNKGPSQNGTLGVRPIGIGETFCRIFGKSVMTVFKSDIQAAGVYLQTCTGIRSGIEAAIHAATDAWQMSSTEAMVQVDTDNAFNRLNRKV